MNASQLAKSLSKSLVVRALDEAPVGVRIRIVEAVEALAAVVVDENLMEDGN